MAAPHALITGGSSGIGRALALRLAADGWNLSLLARGRTRLEDAAAEIGRRRARPDQRVLIFPADVADAAAAELAVAGAIAALGPPELVITSAGIAAAGRFGDVPPDLFARAIEVNYLGSVHVARAVLPAMRAARRGRVVFLSSAAGLLGLYGYTAYAPTKFALRGLAESLRAELKPDKVAVSIVYPPDTDTPQLGEENKTKPEETKRMTGAADIWSADAVAQSILRSIARGAFAITPGWKITLLYRFPGILGPALAWYFDRIVARMARR